MANDFQLDGSAHEEKFRLIGLHLTPERPIRSIEFLRGRTATLADVVRELQMFKAIPFVYGHRGVGKTSLARTAAQQITKSDREHAYVACASGGRFLHVLRDVGQELLRVAFRNGRIETLKKSVHLDLSLTPSLRVAIDQQKPELEKFEDMNAAIRILKDLDAVMPDAASSVVVIDELEVLGEDDQRDLAYLIKQVGDQDFRIKFVLVGIAENVRELIGAHESTPRYIKEISLQPLMAQDLIDVVSNAAEAIGVTVPVNHLMRIAIIGNGFPHFAHLIGKSLLIEAVLANSSSITPEIYKQGVNRAVRDSAQELKNSYDAATQRGQDYFKHLVWALAHSEFVDVRIDEWLVLYNELAGRYYWKKPDEKKLRNAIGRLKDPTHGQIIDNTPSHYGAQTTRYRYKRFKNMLMRGHVRLQAENAEVMLGRDPGM